MIVKAAVMLKIRSWKAMQSDIKEDLDLLGVRLNMPDFMKGKKQLHKRLVETHSYIMNTR